MERFDSSSELLFIESVEECLLRELCGVCVCVCVCVCVFVRV